MLEKIVHVSGKSGLFRMINNRADGLIVEDLANGKRSFVPGRLHQFTPLESIGIYVTTEEETAPLKEVFRGMLQQLEVHALPAANAPDALYKEYFAAVLPTYDREMVKVSDMKKAVKWFGFLNDNGLVTTEDPAESTAEEGQ